MLDIIMVISGSSYNNACYKKDDVEEDILQPSHRFKLGMMINTTKL